MKKKKDQNFKDHFYYTSNNAIASLASFLFREISPSSWFLEWLWRLLYHGEERK